MLVNILLMNVLLAFYKYTIIFTVYMWIWHISGFQGKEQSTRIYLINILVLVIRFKSRGLEQNNETDTVLTL